MNEALGSLAPADFRALFDAIPRAGRDAWFDALLGVSEVIDDSSALPRSCVPYIPAPLDALVRFSDAFALGPGDRVVDVGAGPGRAAIFLSLFSGAHVVALEVQPHLIRVGRDRAEASKVAGVEFVGGDVAETLDAIADPTAVFLYCPFGGARFERVLDRIDEFAAKTPLGLGLLDMPRVMRENFVPLPSESPDLALYRVETPRTASRING